MTKFVLGRLAAMVGVLLVLAFIVLCLQRYTPADPVRAKLGANAPKAAVEAERKRLGYDQPLLTQYASYVGGLVTGDMQESLRTRRPVAQDLGEFVPATLELSVFALAVALVLGGFLGIASAGRWRVSGLLRFLMVSGSALPTFLVALLGLLFFYRRLGWLPSSGRISREYATDGPTGFLLVDTLVAGDPAGFADTVRHLILPGLCVAIGPAVAIGRVLRGSIVSSLGTDYVRTARAKGLRERTVLFRHTIRNSIGPALSMTGLQVGLMFAGVVVVESIFAWPGIGLYTVQSIPRLDFPAIAGVTLVLGAVFVLVNTAVDILQAVADPRIRAMEA